MNTWVDLLQKCSALWETENLELEVSLSRLKFFSISLLEIPSRGAVAVKVPQVVTLRVNPQVLVKFYLKEV